MADLFAGIGSVLGSTIGAISAATTGVKVNRETNEANKAIANATNAANLQIARETNQANYEINAENNLLQQQLANQAYQRSTAKNQLAELMAAGYTQQQAMQLLAGGTQGASAFPVANTNAAQMQAATMQPAVMQSPDLSGMYNSLQGLGSALGSISSDLVSENGGSIGYLQSLGYINRMNSMITEGTLTPDWLLPPADLREKYNELGDSEDDLLKKDALDAFFKSDDFSNVLNSPMAQRSLISFGQKNVAYKTDFQQVQELIARKNAENAATRLTEVQITGEGIRNSLASLEVDYQQAQNELAQLIIDYQESENKIAQSEAVMAELDAYIKQRTSPLLIGETLMRAQTAIAQYEIEYAYKRMNSDQIIKAMENDLDVQIAVALANKVYWTNQQNAESAYTETAFNDDGTMRTLFRIYGACKRFGATPVTNAAQTVTAGAAAGAATAGIVKLFAPKPFRVAGFGR